MGSHNVTCHATKRTHAGTRFTYLGGMEGCRVVFDGGGRGDMSPSLDFGIPLTGIDSAIPGCDAFNPPQWNEFCPSVIIR